MVNHQKFLEGEIRSFIGDLGMARAGIKFLKKKGNKGVIQVNNKSLNEIKTALALIEKENVRTLKVSGMLNKLVDVM